MAHEATVRPMPRQAHSQRMRYCTSWGDDRGSILPLAAISMVTLLGFMGLGLDTGMLQRHRRIMQTGADAGAMAGASEIYRRQMSLVVGAAYTATAANEFGDGVDGVTVTVNHPPASGLYAGNQQYVEVLIDQPSPTYFLRLFGWTTVSVPARAVAGVGANGPNCIYVLDPSMPQAFRMENNATLTAGCGITVNSNHPSAMTAQNSSVVTASSISVTGGAVIQGASVNPTPDEGVPPEPDPLAYLMPPAVGGCVAVDFSVDMGVHVLSPGTYCGGIHAEGNARLILNAGLYIIRGGGLRLENLSSIEGDGVTFFITHEWTGSQFLYEPILMENTTRAELTAPTTGPYAGILFYQDPNAGLPSAIHRFENGANSYFEGAFYFPTQILRFENLSNTGAAYTTIVARELNMENLANLNVPADYSGLPGGSPIKRISLVE